MNRTFAIECPSIKEAFEKIFKTSYSLKDAMCGFAGDTVSELKQKHDKYVSAYGKPQNGEFPFWYEIEEIENGEVGVFYTTGSRLNSLSMWINPSGRVYMEWSVDSIGMSSLRSAYQNGWALPIPSYDEGREYLKCTLAKMEVEAFRKNNATLPSIVAQYDGEGYCNSYYCCKENSIETALDEELFRKEDIEELMKRIEQRIQSTKGLFIPEWQDKDLADRAEVLSELLRLKEKLGGGI